MKRLQEIDILRGIAILFIVVGHFFQGYQFVDYIYIFHVPMFFFISGMCLKIDVTWKTFLLKKLKSLIVPYICLGIVIVPSTFVFITDMSAVSLVKVCLKYLLQQRFTTMWFLTSLFISEIVFYWIVKLSKGLKTKLDSDILVVAVVLVITAQMCFYEKYVDIALPWTLDLGILCVIFLSTGFYFKKYAINKLERLSNTHKLIFAFTLCVLGFIAGSVSMFLSNSRLDIFYGQLGVAWMSIPGSLLISIGGLVICQCILKARCLKYIGEHTMCIFALHQMVFKQIFFKIIKFDTALLITISVIISVIMCIYIDVLISKSKFKWIIGK